MKWILKFMGVTTPKAAWFLFVGSILIGG